MWLLLLWLLLLWLLLTLLLKLMLTLLLTLPAATVCDVIWAVQAPCDPVTGG